MNDNLTNANKRFEDLFRSVWINEMSEDMQQAFEDANKILKLAWTNELDDNRFKNSLPFVLLALYDDLSLEEFEKEWNLLSKIIQTIRDDLEKARRNGDLKRPLSKEQLTKAKEIISQFPNEMKELSELNPDQLQATALEPMLRTGREDSKIYKFAYAYSKSHVFITKHNKRLVDEKGKKDWLKAVKEWDSMTDQQREVQIDNMRKFVDEHIPS